MRLRNSDSLPSRCRLDKKLSRGSKQFELGVWKFGKPHGCTPGCYRNRSLSSSSAWRRGVASTRKRRRPREPSHEARTYTHEVRAGILVLAAESRRRRKGLTYIRADEPNLTVSSLPAAAVAARRHRTPDMLLYSSFFSSHSSSSSRSSPECFCKWAFYSLRGGCSWQDSIITEKREHLGRLASIINFEAFECKFSVVKEEK